MNFSYSFQQGEYILKIYICVNNNIAEQHGSAVATSVVSQQENHMFGPKFLPQSSNMNFRLISLFLLIEKKSHCRIFHHSLTIKKNRS